MKDKNKKHAFSMIELIVVIVIISIISYVAITSYNNISTDTRKTVARQQEVALQTALNTYFSEATSLSYTTKQYLDEGAANRSLVHCWPDDTVVSHDRIPKIDQFIDHYNNLTLKQRLDCVTPYIDETNSKKIFHIISSTPNEIITDQLVKENWFFTLPNINTNSVSPPKVNLNVK